MAPITAVDRDFLSVRYACMEHFSISNPLPDIYHIEDISKVCFTLVVGERDTLLWDTGLGLYDVAYCIAPYIRGKLHVVLSHGHYDHACGAHYFESVLVHPDDMDLCRHSISVSNRKTIIQNAQKRGYLDESFSTDRYLDAVHSHLQPINNDSIDLGGLDVQFTQTVGHTIGSMVAYIPQRQLLLTGDMWNPYTWLFFPESQPLCVYVQSMRGLRDSQAEHVLCSHDQTLRTMKRLRAYIDGLNEQTFSGAVPCPTPPYTQINTYCCHPEPDSVLVFNGDKRD